MLVSSPRTWGCFFLFKRGIEVFRVFPTHVGVFLYSKRARTWSWRLPHARGGVSGDLAVKGVSDESSPRTWGCFPDVYRSPERAVVFPTHVGVFPRGGLEGVLPVCLPHARGGVSQYSRLAGGKCWSSPRTWGCFSTGAHGKRQGQVFPTHVGVFLLSSRKKLSTARLPHARGGVS